MRVSKSDSDPMGPIDLHLNSDAKYYLMVSYDPVRGEPNENLWVSKNTVFRALASEFNFACLADVVSSFATDAIAYLVERWLATNEI
jgi:hypothetical protein